MVYTNLYTDLISINNLCWIQKRPSLIAHPIYNPAPPRCTPHIYSTRFLPYLIPCFPKIYPDTLTPKTHSLSHTLLPQDLPRHIYAQNSFAISYPGSPRSTPTHLRPKLLRCLIPCSPKIYPHTSTSLHSFGFSYPSCFPKIYP